MFQPPAFDKKSANNLTEDHWYVMIHVGSCLQDLSLAFESLIIMCLSVRLYEFSFFGALSHSFLFHNYNNYAFF